MGNGQADHVWAPLSTSLGRPARCLDWTGTRLADTPQAVTPDRLRELLFGVQAGSVGIEQALDRLVELPFADLGVARVDHHRALRQGVPEVIFAQGKTASDVVSIAVELTQTGQTLLVTRANDEQLAALSARFPALEVNARARAAWLAGATAKRRQGRVQVVTAGTSDLPVAEEARVTLAASGIEAELVVDVGVAGIHRLLPEIPRLREADVVIVVAGMEGALASVIGGVVRAPVVAVPTSIGYGASFQGLSALLGMLTSCAAGITCVNIDNGFGAAMAAVRLLDVLERARTLPTENHGA
jgi:pyridinium-3,5-biscarboxylic acid mononucleotide synthase